MLRGEMSVKSCQDHCGAGSRHAQPYLPDGPGMGAPVRSV